MSSKASTNSDMHPHANTARARAKEVHTALLQGRARVVAE
eukprot:CAMPEP_0179998650 /NCGR_PEP_ID=MMETSP0984-20121128/8810_1 /TAXON_ID=483367 /ORGANISM="non described non described, Strain CCMP 2436" /LENGTH=39 /DNA_ID= /DNA_START= /DNA_END= /DNA_ORIENTATION=